MDSSNFPHWAECYTYVIGKHHQNPLLPINSLDLTRSAICVTEHFLTGE